MRLLLIASASITLLATSTAQTTWYVDGTNCDGTGVGTVDDPFCTIQEAIDTASGGDFILVNEGVYVENLVIDGKDLDITGVLGSLRTILRGSPEEIYPIAPCIDVRPATKLEVAGLTIQNGKPGVLARSAKVILKECLLKENEGLEHGYSLRGGALNADQSIVEIRACHVAANYAEIGAGIACVNGNLRVDSTVFRNSGLTWGSAVYSEGGALDLLRSAFYGYWLESGAVTAQGAIVSIHQCIFAGNASPEGNGSALSLHGCDFYVSETEFVENWVFQGGGPVSVSGGQGIFDRCEFHANHVYQGYGGAMQIRGDLLTGLVIRDSLFENNYSSEGGAINVESGKVTVERCTFLSNESLVTSYPEDGYGGALHVGERSKVTARSCVFRKNASRTEFATDGGRGGAVYGPALLQSCTLFDNFISGPNPTGGGAIAGGATLENCILWRNAPDQILDAGAIAWSDIQGGWPGTGNFDADPMFWGPEHGDLHLLPGSPCIDAGDPNFTDQDGTRLDVGAYPFDAGYCGQPGTYCIAKENSAGCTPSIGWTGTPSIAGPDDFHVIATNVIPDQFGILAWSTAGASDVPFLGGTLCIAPPQHHSPVQRSTLGTACDGAIDYHFTQAIMQANGIGVGTRLYFQYWYRDPLHSDGTGAGLTDGLEATVCVGM